MASLLAASLNFLYGEAGRIKESKQLFDYTSQYNAEPDLSLKIDSLLFYFMSC